MVNVEGLTDAQILQALYTNSRPLGMGMLHFTPGPLTEVELNSLINGSKFYFDYVKGRVIKTGWNSGDKEIDTRLYDRDNGEGAGEVAILSTQTSPK